MNQITRIDEFRDILSHYRPSDDARVTLQDLRIALLVGPTASGRNTIINQLVKSGEYIFIVSDTTRQPRVNNGVSEENGREYWFRSEVDMLADLKEGKFLEAAIIHNQQVSGMSVRELKRAIDQHKIAVDEIEIVGADSVHKLIPSAQFLFILPPSFDEWMARMNARGELPPDETKRRLDSAVIEITTALDKDYYVFVVNDTFMQTAKRVDSIIHRQKAGNEEQESAKELARQLLAETEQFLASMA